MIASMHPRSVSYGFHTAGHGLSNLRHQLIARRAYEKWRAKGSPSGSALQDWREAEEEVDAGPRRELVQRRAYEIWQAKGCPAVSALQDWQQAESELDAEFTIESNPHLCRTPMPAEVAPG